MLSQNPNLPRPRPAQSNAGPMLLWVLGWVAICGVAFTVRHHVPKDAGDAVPVVQNGRQLKIPVTGDTCLVTAIANGASFRFVLDSGADDGIVFSRSDARRLGFDPDTLPSDQVYWTMNGKTKGSLIRVSELSIGGAVIGRNLRASLVNADAAFPVIGFPVLKAMNFQVHVGFCSLTIPRRARGA